MQYRFCTPYRATEWREYWLCWSNINAIIGHDFFAPMNFLFLASYTFLKVVSCFLLAGIYIGFAIRTGFVTEWKSRTTIFACPTIGLLFYPGGVARLTDAIAVLLCDFCHIFVTVMELFCFFTWELVTLSAGIEVLCWGTVLNCTFQAMLCQFITLASEAYHLWRIFCFDWA